MRSVLISLPYAPPVSWMAIFLQFENVQIEAHENFEKSSWRSRMEIAGPNGRQLLSIPVEQGRSHHQLYKQVETAKVPDWKKIHWQSLCTAYGRSAYFLYYRDDLEEIYKLPNTSLWEMNLQFLHLICDLIGVKKEFRFSENYVKDPTVLDLRRSDKTQKDILSQLPAYPQVFSERYEFLANLSCWDLIFNLGPDSKEYLKKVDLKDFHS